MPYPHKVRSTPRSGYSWTRSFAYWFGNYDEYKTDEPHDKEIKLKAVLMKQIILSKLRLNKIKTEKKVPYDLQKIKPSKIKINMDDYKRVKTFKEVVELSCVESLEKEQSDGVALSFRTSEVSCVGVEKPILKRQRVEKSQKQMNNNLRYPL